MTKFQQATLEGIPAELPPIQPYDGSISHAPKRIIDNVLSIEEKKLAVKKCPPLFQTSMAFDLSTRIRGRIGKIWSNLYVSLPPDLCNARPTN